MFIAPVVTGQEHGSYTLPDKKRNDDAWKAIPKYFRQTYRAVPDPTTAYALRKPNPVFL
jgi:hypothetical protein